MNLRVGESQTTEVGRDLQAEGAHLLQTLHGAIFNLLQAVILGWIVHLLIRAPRRGEQHEEVLKTSWNKPELTVPQRISPQAPRALEETAPAPHSGLQHTHTHTCSQATRSPISCFRQKKVFA